MASLISRRSLLAHAGRVAGTWVGTAWPQSGPQRIAPSEKLNVAVIGVGNQGAGNLHAIRKENVTSLCDVDRDYLAAAREQFPAAKTFRDYRQALTQPGLDAVVISTPDHTHTHCAIQALRRNLHVYCEKPLTHDLRETASVLQAAGKSTGITQTGIQHHSKSGYQWAMQVLRSGVLGRIQEIHAWTNRPIWPQPVGRPTAKPDVPQKLDWNLWLGPAPQRPYHGAYHPMTWRGFWDFGGGALADMGSHLLDPVVGGLALPDPHRVRAKCSPVGRESAPKWSVVTFHFRYQTRELPLIWYDGNKQPPKSLTRLDPLPPNGVLVVGKRGRLFIPSHGRQPHLLANPGQAKPPLSKPTQPPAADHYQQWLTACRAGKPSRCGFEYGARLARISHLGNLAIRSGQPVKWDRKARRLVDSPLAEPFVGRKPRAGWTF